MLKQRVITAIILVIVLLGALLAQQDIYWRAFINLVVLVGFWEWLRFCKISELIHQAFAFLAFIALLALLQAGTYISLPAAVIVTCILWFALFVFTITNKVDFMHRSEIKLLIGMIVLAVACTIVVELKGIHNGKLWVMCFLVSVWAADIGAYFIGRRFGKTKLAPSISPGKTVEGLLGGLALALLLFVPLAFYFHGVGEALLLVLTVLVTVLVSVLGDLFVSKQKRFADLKDSSNILPGHGGVLDRIDSLLAGAPFFALGLIALGLLA